VQANTTKGRWGMALTPAKTTSVRKPTAAIAVQRGAADTTPQQAQASNATILTLKVETPI